MTGTGVIDSFLNVFTGYIDSGFGLLHGEVAFLASSLIVIDVTLAALFWAWGEGDDILARLVKKTLFVGMFAYLIGDWTSLARIVFESFAGLGLKAAGAGLAEADFLRPGRIAQAGLDAGQPLLQSISGLMGYVSFFENFIQIAVLLLAWIVVVLAFFILAIQLFVTLIEFKLTTLCGFVLIPFGLFGKTAFLAERVLGNVVASGVKVLVLAAIVGIGSTLFSQFTTAGSDATAAGAQPTIDDAMTIVLAALSLLGLGLFGPGIANGLISGGPQLGAGAAVGTGLAAGGVLAAGGAAAGLAVGGAAGAITGAAKTAATVAGGATSAYQAGGALGVARAAGAAASSPLRRAAEGLKARFETGAQFGGAAGGSATSGSAASGSAASGSAASGPGEGESSSPPGTRANTPAWASRLQREQALNRGAEAAAQAVRGGDHGGGGASVDLSQGE